MWRIGKVERQVLFGAISGVTVLFGSILLNPGNVLAKVTGANGSKPMTGNACGFNSWSVGHIGWCGVYGVSWRFHSLASLSGNANYANEAEICDKEDTEGIYILAYEKFKKTANGGRQYLNQQVINDPAYNVQVNRVTSGAYNLIGPSNPYGVTGVYSMAEAKTEWEKYKDAYDGSTSWGNTTWFCGDKHDEPQKGLIMAESGVKVNGVNEERTGAKIGPKSTGLKKDDRINGDNGFVTISTSQPSMSGEIFHNLEYKNADSNWDNVKAKDKKYDFDLDLAWCTADGDQALPGTACDITNSGDVGSWKIPAKNKTDSASHVGKKPFNLTSGQSYCQTLSPDPLKFTFNATSKGKDPDIEEAGTGNTTACVTVNHVDKPAEPKDEFWATSSVQVPNASAQLGGYDPGKQTSDKDAAVGLKVSTDSDSLHFTLSHNMDFDWTDWARNMWRYWNGCISTNADGSCNGDWVYVGSPTKLSYELSNLQLHNATLSEPTVEKPQVAKTSSNDPSGGADVNSYINDIYPAGADKDTDNGGAEVSKYTYTISGMEKGKTYKVCHKIKYDPKTYTTPITESLVWTGPWSIGPQWNYGTPVGSGSEDSEACIEITRPADPPEGGAPDPYGPKNGGNGASDIMYAGEHTGISWKVAAKSVPTRRVKDYSAIGFVVRDDVTDASVVNAGGHVSSDPCDYFRTKSGGRLISFDGANCAEFSGDGLSIEENTDGIAGKATQLVPTPNNSEQDAFTQPLDIAVPDNVGGKYCNSYGYKWGYWWGVAKASDASGLTDDIATWTYVTGKDYWTIYSATCRTIAKKPSFAVWNGSLFSGAGVSSSTAPRHNEANNDQPTKLNNDSEKTTYGSWAENIVVAQNEVSRFASSGVYGAGIPGLVSGNQWDMAWQTITNMGLVAGGNMLGNSGINYNSSYSTRLSAYLKSHATNTDQEAESYGGATGVGDTQILYFNPGGKNGTLTISGNVELANTSGKTIYEMPQVVIYVDGNVKIAPSVTRLDAWIIANGNVDTCDGWVEKTTETQSVYRNQNTACDNRLQINGPVVAKSVTLNRTYGADPLVYSGTGKYTSSEVFNLSALSYLWSFAQAGRYDSSYTDAYARELAPRY